MVALEAGAASQALKPKKPKLPPPPSLPDPTPELIAEPTIDSTSRQERRSFRRRFNRQDTILAGNDKLGQNPNLKTLFGF